MIEVISIPEWHKTVAMLVARGVSLTEISEKTGRSLNELSALYKQKTFADLVSKEIREDGDVLSFLKGMTVDSLLAVVAIRDDNNTPPSVRLSAANSLLDRALGKPASNIRQINVNESTSDDPVTALRDLERQIEQEKAKAKV